MPIAIVPEDGIPASLPLERCCFCRKRTNMWAPKADVACCTPCAETHEEADLPTKAEWCAKEDELTPSPFAALQRLSA